MNPITIALVKIRRVLDIPPLSESQASRIILFVFVNSVATSVWFTNVWSPFIFTSFGESNYLVGLMAAINGISEMCTAIVSGYIADKVWGPSRTLQFAQLLGLIALSTILIGVWSMNLYLIELAQCLAGAYMGFSFTCVESVFAQCLRTGERDWLYSVKFSLEASGPITGLCLTIILFSIMGNEWNLSVLQWVMTSGLCLNITSILAFLCTFKPIPYTFNNPGTQNVRDVVVCENPTNTNEERVPGYGRNGHVSSEGVSMGQETCEKEDKRIVIASTEDLAENVPDQSITQVHLVSSLDDNTNHTLEDAYETLDFTTAGPEDAACVREHNGSFYSSLPTNTCEVEGADKGSPWGSGQQLWTQNANAKPPPSDPNDIGDNKKDEPPLNPVRRLHYVDMEAEKAKGLRKKILLLIPLKYYPYFLVIFDVITVFGSGMTVQYFILFMMKIYNVNPLEMATLNLFNAIIIMGLGILCGVVAQRYGRVRTILPPKILASMVLLWMALARGTTYAPKVLMCIAYVVRGAFMNCSAGLSRALVMDVIPEHQHSRWNAIESIQSAGWSGTAFLGGFLADRWGYGGAFIVTFCFHITSCALLLPLALRNDTRLPVLVDDNALGTTPGSRAPSSAIHGVTIMAEEQRGDDFHPTKGNFAQHMSSISKNEMASNG